MARRSSSTTERAAMDTRVENEPWRSDERDATRAVGLADTSGNEAGRLIDEFAECWAEKSIKLPWLHLRSVGALLSTAVGEILPFRLLTPMKIADRIWRPDATERSA